MKYLTYFYMQHKPYCQCSIITETHKQDTIFTVIGFIMSVHIQTQHNLIHFILFVANENHKSRGNVTVFCHLQIQISKKTSTNIFFKKDLKLHKYKNKVL